MTLSTPLSRTVPLALAAAIGAGCAGQNLIGGNSSVEDGPCAAALSQMNGWAQGLVRPISAADDREMQRLALATEQACSESALAGPELTRADAALAAAYAMQRRFPAAHQVLEDAPQQDSPESLMLLANLTGQGLGVDKNPRRAVELLDRAAAVGGADFKIRVAQEFLDGGSVPRDPARAKTLYQSAISDGSDAAMLAYATDYLGLFRPRSEPAQVEQALGWVRRAADEKKSGDAMAMLAGYYLSDRGRDLDQAEQWADKALATGNKRAYRAKGLVAFGRFRQIAAERQRDDYSQEPTGVEAVKWFRQGAEAGDAQSALYLGELYFNGVGVDRDPAEAERWLRRARAGGNRQAALLLSKMAKAGAAAPAG